jgi:hypothetical protein
MIDVARAEKRRKVSRGPFTSRFLLLEMAIKNPDASLAQPLLV